MKREIRTAVSVWLAVTLLGTLPAWGQTVIRVSTTGDNANDGSDWTAAKLTVQAGLNAAAPGDQVWVAAGTYVERITLTAGVALYGGFAGGETELTQRNWMLNKTILDGNQGGSVVTSPAGATATTRIDGFTIRNGSGTVSGSYRYGGGIYCSASSPTIANNRIVGNRISAGGGGGCGIYSSGSSSCPTITNNTITENTASLSPFSALVYGGAVHCDNGSFPTIANNTITANVASDGGGIYCSSSSPMIVNNTITDNTATVSGGAIYCSSASPAIVNTIIAFNASGVYVTGSGGPTFRSDCVFGNTEYGYSGLTDPTGTDGNISVDPGFAARAYGNLHVQHDSPCVDAGDGDAVQPDWLDMDGQTRIQGEYVDIGADESDDTEWPAGPPVIVRVSPDGNDANDGATWEAAKGTVQAGIDAAAIAGGEVWVKAGTYPGQIALRPWVYLYGGFNGAEEARDQRNFRSNVTTLDGQTRGPVVRISSAGYGVCLDGFTVRNGRAGFGAGVLCESSSPTIANNTIADNYALADMDRSGGAAGIYCRSSSATIVNNRITGNTGPAGDSNPVTGGGIGSSDSSLTVANNTIVGNLASLGGGIGCYHSSLTIANNMITGNVATMAGGGIFSERGSSLTITNNTIAWNGAPLQGGGIYCYSPAMIACNTIVANSASDGGGVYCSSLTIVDTIVAFNSSGIDSGSSGVLTSASNCVYGNAAYNYHGRTRDPTGTNGNISADPKFAGWQYGNVHIRPGSPCINAGDDSLVQSAWLDMDGQTRIQDGHVDIGADESDGTDWPTGPYTIVRVSLEGDDTNDGTTWNAAKRTVQGGIDAASTTGGEVWVKEGTYLERITLRSFAYVYGGFSGTEAARAQRDFRANVTVLDGQEGGSVVTARAGYACSTIDGFTIQNGHANPYGGGIYCDVGASPTIANNTITRNIAEHGGGICCYSGSSPTIEDNVLTGNGASSGAGIYCYGYSSPTIANNAVTGNTASRYGGGIGCSASYSPRIANNTIAGNTASSGGGIYCKYSSLTTLVNNTIAGNTASLGGAIYSYHSSLTIANTLIALNSSGVYRDTTYPDTISLRYNCVYGNPAYDYSGLTDPTGTNGNISADPLFVRNPTDGGDGWGVGDNDDYGDLRLRTGSPCIDAGDNAAVPADLADLDGDGDTTEPLPFDPDGRLRFVDDFAITDTGLGAPPIVDIGAYERYPDTSMDFDLDGDVDMADFQHFRECMNGPNRPYAASGCADADYDRDTDVDLLDFSRFRTCFNGSNRPAVCP